MVRVGNDAQDRTEIVELSERLVPDLVTPLAGGTGTCRICATWIRGIEIGAPHSDDLALQGLQSGTADSSELSSIRLEGGLCENCGEVRDVLGLEPLPLCVVSFYRKPSRLRDTLTRYKGRESGEDEFDEGCVPTVRAMLGRYFIEHGVELENVAGGFDAIVVVPSTERPPPHPLAGVVDSLDLDVPSWPLLARGPGEMSFRKPSKDGYRVVVNRGAARILLLDDVYTTGSRLNSAAYALRQQGHDPVAALVLARRINVEYAPEAMDLWDRSTASDFDWVSSPRTIVR